MNKSVRYRFYIAFIILISFFCNVLNIPSTISNSNTFEINNFDDLLKYSQLSRQDGFNDANYILKADIAITEDDISKMSSSDVGFLTFGSSDMPFSGTFDGEDHTISNLSFSSSLAIRADTALFSQTNGATIKNVCGALSALILIWLFIKFATNFQAFLEEIKNPIMSSIIGTYCMALMILGGYKWPSPEVGKVIWFIGLILHVILIIFHGVMIIMVVM